MGLRAFCRARSGDENQSTEEANLRLEERAVMSDDQQREENGNEVNCASNPLDPESQCNLSMPWLLLLLEDE